MHWVPGRVEVFGKHTDYAGGRSIVSAVPRGMVIAASPRRDGRIHVLDARRNESVALPSDSAVPGSEIGEAGRVGVPPAGRAFTGWRRYAAVVARRLARNFPGAGLGADVVIASDLPRASG